MSTEKTIADHVREAVCEILEPDGGIPDDAALVDHDMDSLGFVEIILAIEERCEVDIPDDLAFACSTTADFIRLTERLIAARSVAKIDGRATS